MAVFRFRGQGIPGALMFSGLQWDDGISCQSTEELQGLRFRVGTAQNSQLHKEATVCAVLEPGRASLKRPRHSRSTVLLPGTRRVHKSSHLAATLDPVQPALSFSGSRVAVETVSRRVFLKTLSSSAQRKPLRLHECWKQPAKACQQGVQGKPATVAGLLTSTVSETSAQ